MQKSNFVVNTQLDPFPRHIFLPATTLKQYVNFKIYSLKGLIYDN